VPAAVTRLAAEAGPLADLVAAGIPTVDQVAVRPTVPPPATDPAHREVMDQAFRAGLAWPTAQWVPTARWVPTAQWVPTARWVPTAGRIPVPGITATGIIPGVDRGMGRPVG
jgi:hypothetical protein